MISVCIITKNECEKLENCLKHIDKNIMEIIIVDTGSTDNTKEMVKKYTDKVYDYVWNDDFSAARNYSLSKATNDYVLILDSDECIERMDYSNLIERIDKSCAVGRIKIINYYRINDEEQVLDERICRFFNKKFYCYQGKIHEQVVSKTGSDISMVDVPIEIIHTGYNGSKEELNCKAMRNIQLLEREVAQNGKDPYFLYQLGKSYYMMGNYKNSCEYFEKALEFDLNSKLEYVNNMIQTYGYALLNTGQNEKALLYKNIYDDFATNADFCFLMGLIYMNNAKFNEAIHEYKRATEYKDCSVKGVNSFKAYYNIGVIYECLGFINEALIYYKKCGDYKLAVNRKRIIEKSLEQKNEINR